MIKDIEERGGSEEYVRSLTDKGVAEVPYWSPATSSNWPSTPCSVRTAHTGQVELFTCTITATSIYLGTWIKTYVPLVPDTPDAKLLIKPDVRLEGQECGWFVATDVERKNFFICFWADTAENVIAIVTGPGVNVQIRPGGQNRVRWM